MGFQSIVSGYILVSNLEEALRQIKNLPSAAEKEFPPMPREIFSVVTEPDSLVNYKGDYTVHFGMCVKDIQECWVEWLDRFEKLFKSMGAEEAFVVLKAVPYTNPQGFDGRWYYRWKLEYRTGLPAVESKQDRLWVFEGDPRDF